MSDYSYEAFCGAVAARDGWACRVAEILAARRPAVPSGLLKCVDQYGQTPPLVLDGHHVGVSKQRIKRRWEEDDFPDLALRDALEDPRNGILACRRHHDLLERHLIRLFRDDLPVGCVDFAEELGLGWSVDRDYPPRPAAASSLEDRYTNTEADAAEFERMREWPE